MIIVVISALCLLLAIICPILFITPVAQTGASSMLGILWVWKIGLWGVSLSKVSMFEVPKNPMTPSTNSSGDVTIKLTTISKSTSSSNDVSTQV